MPENTSPPAGERIAKLLSRRGVASRREAERLIEAGEVTVNGKVITSPALNVTGDERITVSGRLLPEEEEARLWLYYKPEGLVTTASDEKGRDTVFDHLPEDMPRVMSIGRLDLNSEGLLLLTNDGGLKRRLELPSTGWLRKYRVRVNGQADEVKIQTLRDGITVDGEHFKPMQVTIDRQQGANAWFTIGLREGKNREIRRAMNAIGLYVNRLIRVSYGPFRLGDLEPGQVEEVKARVLRDQLGEIDAEADKSGTAKKRPALTRVRAGRAAADGPRGTAGPRSAPRSAAAAPAKPARGRPGEARGADGGERPRSGGGGARPLGARSAAATQGARAGFTRAAPSRDESAGAEKPGARSAGRRAAGAGFGAGTAARSTRSDEDRSDARPGAKPGARPAAARPSEGKPRAGKPAATGEGRPAKPRAPKLQSTRNAPPGTTPRKPGGPGRKG